MKDSIRYTVEYAHPRENVWAAVATRDALAAWLMPNDFEPVVGHRFTFRTDPAPGFDGIVHCEVLECDVLSKLSYSWRGGPLDSVVTYTLESIETGTRLHFEHRGFDTFKAKMIGAMLGRGWKRMSRTTLPAVLDRLDEQGNLGPARETPDMSCEKGWFIGRIFAPLVAMLPGKRGTSSEED